MRERLRSLGWRLHPIANLAVGADDPWIVEKRFGTVFNLWLIAGFLILGWIEGLLHFEYEHAIQYLDGLYPKFPYSQLIVETVFWISTLAFAGIVGYLSFRVCLIFVALVVRALSLLEQYTASGVVGIIGFLLFSAAAIINLSGLEH